MRKVRFLKKSIWHWIKNTFKNFLHKTYYRVFWRKLLTPHTYLPHPHKLNFMKSIFSLRHFPLLSLSASLCINVSASFLFLWKWNFPPWNYFQENMFSFLGFLLPRVIPASVGCWKLWTKKTRWENFKYISRENEIKEIFHFLCVDFTSWSSSM